ncbi:MAG: LPS export ABC transporter periplasmic protein LptC [Treponema sp.]|nr:LPS export ABC transporter periplasmic protein LptC [Treponema sp.]MCL2250640.1 LPS export ABC transporter periplasmic protein LptC [Treponema sp.]
MKNTVIILVYTITFLFVTLFTASCTFDYGETDGSERESPDLIMENVEYVRVRSYDPIARFQAERAERYEKQGIMKLQNFIFEQYGEKGEEVNAYGKAGYASIVIGTGDISMDNGVRIEVESEDIILETKQLEWKDEPRILSTPETSEVNIYQENGTHFIGTGLYAETRSRKWEFKNQVTGIFISDDESEEIEKDVSEEDPETIQSIVTEEIKEEQPEKYWEDKHFEVIK